MALAQKRIIAPAVPQAGAMRIVPPPPSDDERAAEHDQQRDDLSALERNARCKALAATLEEQVRQGVLMRRGGSDGTLCMRPLRGCAVLLHLVAVATPVTGYAVIIVRGSLPLRQGRGRTRC